MGFHMEAEMIAPVYSWLSQRVEHVKREFRTPWGYCDLVGCSLSPSRVRKRLKLRQRDSIGSIEKVDLFWQIPDEGSGTSISIEELTAYYAPFMSRKNIVDGISSLERRGFVIRDSRGRFQKRNGWFPLHSRLVAVEAKMTRVEESISQAVRHLTYADESYVALPSCLARKTARSGREHEFRNLGLGLLAVTDESVRVLIKSRNFVDRDPILQTHSVEKFWRLHFTSSSA